MARPFLYIPVSDAGGAPGTGDIVSPFPDGSSEAQSWHCRSVTSPSRVCPVKAPLSVAWREASVDWSHPVSSVRPLLARGGHLSALASLLPLPLMPGPPECVSCGVYRAQTCATDEVALSVDHKVGDGRQAEPRTRAGPGAIALTDLGSDHHDA